MQFKLLCAAALTALAATGLPAQGSGKSAPFARPSFDCSRATSEIDKTICGDPKLAEADATMARLYSAAGVSAFGSGPSNQLEAQRKWLKDRANCRVVDRVYKSRSDCLTGYYLNRNHALAVAALFTERELALKTLREIDREGAPLYEAILLYAEQPVGSDWTSASLASKRTRILELLGGYSNRLRDDEDLGYGRDILKDLGIEGPGDPLNSDEKFAQFLQVASAYLGGEPIPRPMPCAAIVRHPKLLDATAAIFGSTLDNFILYPDCQETLPPLPRLTALEEKLWETWPECQGTIRFSFYRSFAYTVSAARLGSREDQQAYGQAADGARAIPRRQGVDRSMVAAATAELEAYYRTHQLAPAKDARAFAAAKIRHMMGQAHECETEEG